MIFEQAFIALPEFLVGTGFTRYDAEGTLVMSYAMSVLQELNGRNVNNPISLVSGETPYPNTRSRTVDLHLDYKPIGILNANLAAFGVREQSWLEAKFFRKNNGTPTLDTTKGAYALLRDILRLTVFPPENPGGTPLCSRYLLHVYEGIFADHLSIDRNIGGGGGRQTRSWLKDLHLPGDHQIQINDLAGEPQSFDTEVGLFFRTIDLSVNISTLSLSGTGTAYSLYLTRISAFKGTIGQKCIELTSTSSSESAQGDWNALRSSFDAELQK